MRVLAVTPTYGDLMRPEMRAALAVALTQGRQAGMTLDWLVLSDNPWRPPDNRNVLHMYRQAQQRALAERYDAMWTIEDDIILPPDAALRLAETPGDVTYGIYMCMWGRCYAVNVAEYTGSRGIGGSLSAKPEKLLAARQTGIVRCSGVGWGCTWIRRTALQSIELPEEWPENPPYDLAFAQRAVRAKLQLAANLNVTCGHVKNDQVLWPFEELATIVPSDWTLPVGNQRIPMYEQGEWTQPEILPVVALGPVQLLIEGEQRALRQGERMELPTAVAIHLSRAGYVAVAP